MGKFARGVLAAALAMVLLLAGPGHAQKRDDSAALDGAATLAGEALKLFQAGKHAEAEAVFLRSLAIMEKVLGPDHGNVGAALYTLALMRRAQGRLPEAEPLFKRSLAILEKAHGAHHRSVGDALDGLAGLYQAQGRYAEAEPLLKRSLDIIERALGPEHRDVGAALYTLGSLYQTQGRYAEAEPLLRRNLTIVEKALGPEHRDVAAALNSLAGLYQAQGQYAEAEPFFLRSLEAREKALGPEHIDVATTLNGLAQLYFTQGRYAEAEQSSRRSLDILEKVLGPEHENVGAALYTLALMHNTQGRFPEAEPLFKRSLAIFEKALGAHHRKVGGALYGLAGLYHAQGHYAEAEPLLKRSLGIMEKALGPEHRDVGAALYSLGSLYQTQGRYAEAEPLFRRCLTIVEKALGPDHRDVGAALYSLAGLYQTQGRYAEAEPLLKRSLAIVEAALGPEHADVAAALNDLAAVYRDQGRPAEAEPLYQRSLGITEKALGLEHPGVAVPLSSLALLHQKQGRFSEAEPLYQRSLAIVEKALGSEHDDVARALNELAVLYQEQDRLAEAGPLYRRSLAIYEKVLGPEHPNVARAHNNLATLAVLQRDWAQAADHWSRSTGIIKRRAERGLGGSEASGSEAQRQAWQFWMLTKVAHRAAPRPDASVAADMFVTAQWAAASQAADALGQAAARSAKGQLAGLVRERQDLTSEWQTKDKLLIAAKSEAPAKRKPAAEKALADRIAAIDIRLGEIDRRLAREFPDYAALVRPAPISVAEVQAQLRADEALVLFLETPEWTPLPEETFVWVVTKSEMRWVRSELGTTALGREVGALRCGLDDSAWDSAGKEWCAEALGMPSRQETPSPLPFDQARAHKLYTALFGEVLDLIEGKHLLIVASGALTQLPFQVLVTEAVAEGVRPSGSDTIAQPSASEGTTQRKVGAKVSDPKGLTPSHRAVAWLARKHAITVLPAVSSLRALRRVGRPSTAPKPMIGFGNPLLAGSPGSADDARRAQLARASQRCPEPRGQRAVQVAARAGVARRAGVANLAHIKLQAPLPETADELCTVARAVKASPRDVRLGAQATEREVKRLSASGELARYRIVHFATHGVLAGELRAARPPGSDPAPPMRGDDGFVHEAGLILTPPKQTSDEDDGFLSASEVASLKLDADWVILSACNTAAGASESAEALSGLARAFIYAQARALLVSHWAVYSEATKKLVTSAFAEMARDAKVGRAEALRRAMLALIDRGEPYEAHPAFWAPFVVVGEGAASR